MILRMLIPVAALLFSGALLLVGQGIQLTLLPVRAEMEGFGPTEIALTGSSYFVGFVAGCLLAPTIIRRVGHIRSFAVLAAVFASVTLLFHGLPVFEAWLLFRLMVGLCIAGLYTVIESWLNETASRESRGTVLSIYIVINMLMMVVGQQLLNLSEPGSGVLFGLAAIFICLAIVPVSLTLALTPAPLQQVPLRFSRVWELSHVGVAGAATSGLVTGAFWALGPLFASQVGMDTRALTLFMSAVVLGGALFQLPLGRLSDRFDRRLVLLGTALAGTLVSLVIGFMHEDTGLLPPLAVLWGGMVMTLYAICLAHAADHADPREFVMVGSCVLLLFGASSAVGAPLASRFMELAGPGGLFLYSASCLALFAVFIVVRRHQHYLPVVDETEGFRVAGETSPAAFVLDPRVDEEGAEHRPAEWEEGGSETPGDDPGDGPRV